MKKLIIFFIFIAIGTVIYFVSISYKHVNHSYAFWFSCAIVMILHKIKYPKG